MTEPFQRVPEGELLMYIKNDYNPNARMLVNDTAASEIPKARVPKNLVLPQNNITHYNHAIKVRKHLVYFVSIFQMGVQELINYKEMLQTTTDLFNGRLGLQEKKLSGTFIVCYIDHVKDFYWLYGRRYKGIEPENLDL